MSNHSWTRVLTGWYSLNVRTGKTIRHMEIVKTDLGLWKVTVDEVVVGLVETLAAAKRVALAG